MSVLSQAAVQRTDVPPGDIGVSVTSARKFRTGRPRTTGIDEPPGLVGLQDLLDARRAPAVAEPLEEPFRDGPSDAGW
jgi:hypothetical protein